LNCEPVLARPPSRLYEFQKTVRRHSFGVAAAGAVMGVLLIGTTVSTWLYLQEKQARQLADAEARKNQQLAQSFRNALDIAHPNPQAGDLPQVRKVLDEVVASLPLDFPNQPEVAMVLRTSLISDYENLELWPQAAELASQNVQVARAHFSPNDAAIAVAFAQLGRDQWQAGWHAVAEASLRQALAGNGKRIWPGDLRHAQGALASLVEILLPLRQPTVDEQLLHQLLTPAVEQYPNEAGVVAIRGNFFARRAQWKAAAADLARAVELDPANPLYYHALAPLRAAESDVQNYRQLCSRILAGFRGATDPATADRMAKDCLIVPSSGVDLTLVDRMADTAATGGHPYELFCKGLTQYRLGRFASAAEWMNEVLTHHNRNPVRDVEAYMVLAMAQHRSKQADEANAALARGVDIAESKLPKLDSGDLGDGWIDWIIAHALIREAKALIEGQADLPSNQTKGK
jgi:tetratricopeptide (TPR) repeat protein